MREESSLSLRLPQNLFTSHRLIEEDEHIFRLNDQYRLTLLAGSDAPLPAALPNEELSPLQATPALARHLAGIYAHFVRLDDSRELLSALIQRIIRLAEQAPDGCVAAILLAPYSGYTAHHAINCALLAARISGGLKLDPEERKTLTGAALTMNLGSAEVQNLLATQNGPPSTLQRQILDIHPLLSSAMLREAKIDSTQRWPWIQFWGQECRYPAAGAAVALARRGLRQTHATILPQQRGAQGRAGLALCWHHGSLRYATSGAVGENPWHLPARQLC